MGQMTLPKGWKVENLGLISAVEFTCWDGCKLLWCDGKWSVVSGQNSMPARGVAYATTMAEARGAGTDFLVKLETA